MRWIAFNTGALPRSITDTPPQSGRSTLHGGTGGASCWLPGNAWRFQSRWWRWGWAFLIQPSDWCAPLWTSCSRCSASSGRSNRQWGDHFNELVNQFGSKTGSVYIELLKKSISQQPCIWFRYQIQGCFFDFNTIFCTFFEYLDTVPCGLSLICRLNLQ